MGVLRAGNRPAHVVALAVLSATALANVVPSPPHMHWRASGCPGRRLVAPRQERAGER